MSNKGPSYQDLEKQIEALKAENKILQIENRFNLLLKASEDMITIHKLNGEYIYYNGPSRYAITSKDVVGKNINDLFDKENSTKLLKIFKNVQKTGKSETIEVLLDWFGEKKWFSEYIYPNKNDDGKVIEIVKVCKDIHERKIAEKQNKVREQQLQELALSRQKIETTLRLLEKSEYSRNESSRIAKIGHWEYYISKDSFIFSDYIYQIYGLQLLEKIPSREKFIELYDKKSQKKIAEVTEKLTLDGIPYDVELKLINFKGQELWVRMVVQLIYNSKKEIIGRRGVLHNITETKKAQIALQVSQKKTENSLELLRNKEISLHEISSIAKIGYWNYDIEKAKIVWSDYQHEIFGVDPKDGIPSREKLLSYFDLKSQKMIEEANQKLNSEGIPYDIEVRLINDKKEEVWVRNVVQPVYDKENKFIGRRGLLQDITEFKKAQLELESSKEEIQSTLSLLEKSEYSKNEASKIAKIGYWEVDKVKDKTFWSENLHKIIGSNPKKGIPKLDVLEKHLSKKYFKVFKEATENLMLKGKSYDIELKLVNLKGNTVWFRNVAQPIYNKQNLIVGRRGVLQDITEFKNTQLELELSKNKLENTLSLLDKRNHLMDSASKIAKIGFCEVDSVNETETGSDYIYTILAANPKDGTLIKEEIIKLLTKESLEKLAKATQDLILKGLPYDIEVEFVNSKKEKVWVRNVAQPIFNKQKEVVGRRGIMQNITDSKKTQQDLEISKQTIQESLSQLAKRKLSMDEASKVAKIGYWEHELINESVIWSDYMHEILGSNLENGIPDKNSIMQNYSKESLKIFDKATKDLLFKGQSYDIVLQYNHPKKGKIWVRNVAQPIYNLKDKVIGKRGVLQDITDQKLKQQELDLKNDELFKLNNTLNEAQKLSHVGSWQWNISTDEAEWSDEMYNIYGVTKENFYPSNENVAKTVLPEDLPKIEKGISSLLIDEIFIPFEFRILRPTGEIRHLYIMALEKNSGDSIFGVTKDITERKVIEEKNKLITERYIELFDNATVSIWNEDFTSVFKYIDNLKKQNITNIREYLEKKPEVLTLIIKLLQINKVNKATLKLFEANSIDEFFNNIQLTFGEGADVVFRNLIIAIWNNEKSFTSEVNYKTLKGKQFAAIISVPIQRSKTGQNNVPVSIQSIQSIKEAESEKKESLRRLKETQELARLGSWVFNFSNKQSDWSDETFRIWGIKPELGVPDFDTFISKIDINDRAAFLNAANLATTKGVPYNIEFRIHLPNGEQKWVRSICKPVFGNSGELINLTGSNQDITVQKLRQKELDTQNEKLFDLNNTLNEAQKLSHVGSWKWNMNTDEAEWSDEMYNIYGVTKENFYPSHENVSKTIYPDDLHKIENAVRSLKYNNKFIPFEFRMLRPSGEIRYLYIMAFEKKADENLFGVTKDITNQKIIEQKNKLITERYIELFENATVSIWNEDLTLVFKHLNKLRKLAIPNIKKYLEENPELLFLLLKKVKINKVNRATLKLFKAKNSDEFLDNIELTFGADADKVFVGLMAAIWHKEKTFTSEVNYKTLKGEEFAAIVSIPIPQTETEQKTVPVSIQSIQSIKEAESAKLESINKLNEAQKMAKVGSWLYTLSTEKVVWSEETFRIFGYDPKKDIPYFKTLLKSINLEDQELVFKSFNSEAPFDIEHRNYMPNGDEKWIRTICEPNFNEEGVLISYRGSNQDITEQKLRRKELDIQNEKLFDLNNSLNYAQKLAKLGSWFFYPLTEAEEWSKEMYDIWGFDSNKGIPDYKIVLDRIHPEDIESFKLLDDKAINEGIPYNIEFRIILPNNIIKTINSICKPVFGDDGKVISLAGTNQDITEKKLISRQIEKAEEMYRLLADNSNDLICLHEPDSTFKYISPSIKDILGFEQSEKIGELGFSLIYKDDVQFFRDSILQRIYKKVPNTTFYCRAQHKNGEILWLEFSTSAVFKNNKPDYILTSSRDVTEWKLAKEEIQEYQISLQKMTTEMTLIEEKQKKEIASNIHDHLSQSLVISKMKINELKKNPELKIIDKDLKFIDTHISEALENSRKITYELSPPVLYQLGIIDALNWLLENVEATHNIECKVQSNISSINLGDVKSILLYRCIQEVIKNAVKYANATLLTLEINKNDLGVNILFVDNGDGFDTKVLNNYKNHSGSGFGLFAVQERIRNIQGEFVITSQLNIGTSVNIFIPLSI